MARTCSICTHPHRAAIDRQLIANVPMLTLAKEFSVGRMALHRHKIRCARLPPANSKAALAARREPTQAAVAFASLPSREELGSMLISFKDRLDAIATRCEAEGASVLSISAIDKMRLQIEALARLAGHTGGAPTVNVGVQINLTPAEIASALAERLAGTPPKTIEAALDDG